MTDLTQTIARIIDPEAFQERKEIGLAWRRAREKALARARQIIPLIEAGVREECHKAAWKAVEKLTAETKPENARDASSYLRAANAIAAAIRAGKEGGG